MKYFTLFFLSVSLMFGKGILIVGAGLSGSGKSSTFKELHKIVGGKLFLEPEEKEIPQQFLNKDFCDEFTLILGFRSVRVPQLYEAYKLRNLGEMVFLDSYFNKIMSLYIKNKNFSWLISKKNPYFRILVDILDKDTQLLPNADVIVYFDISYNTWIKFLQLRGRVGDKNKEFLESYSNHIDIKNAVYKIAKKYNIKVIIFHQKFSNPKVQARKLKKILEHEGILK